MTRRKEALTFELVIATKISSAAAMEIIKDVLIAQGVDFKDIVEVNEKPFVYLSVYFKSAVKAKVLRERLRRLKLKSVSLKIKGLRKKDWFTKWQEEFRPFKITPGLRIVPAWIKNLKPLRGTRDLSIDTGLAFGSGLHPTTKAMANLIHECRGRFDRFLDIGTGSGILALIALANGAQSVCAIDIEFQAIKAARLNLRDNGFKRQELRKIGLEAFVPDKKFDYVAANLITHDLIKHKRAILRQLKKGAYLAVSGISVNNAPHFKKEFAKLSLRCLKSIKDNGWCAFLYKKI